MKRMIGFWLARLAPAAAVAALSTTAQADSLDTWTPVTVFSSSSVNSASASNIAFGNGVFIVPGPTGYVERSSDGRTWSAVKVPATGAMMAVTYANGQFVAAFRASLNATYQNGIILTSPDGIAWTQRASVPETPNCLAYANGTWLGCAKGGVFASTDTVTWTKNMLSATTATSSLIFTSIAFGNGQWVGVGANPAAWSSPDGKTWTQHQAPNALLPSAVGFANGQFVAAGKGTILTSADGITWTSRTVPNASAWYRAITFAAGTWVTVGRTNNYPSTSSIASSSDGVNWTAKQGPTYELQGLAFGASKFVAITTVGATTAFYDYWAWAPGATTTVSKTTTTTGETPPIVVAPTSTASSM